MYVTGVRLSKRSGANTGVPVNCVKFRPRHTVKPAHSYRRSRGRMISAPTSSTQTAAPTPSNRSSRRSPGPPVPRNRCALLEGSGPERIKGGSSKCLVRSPLRRNPASPSPRVQVRDRRPLLAPPGARRPIRARSTSRASTSAATMLPSVLAARPAPAAARPPARPRHLKSHGVAPPALARPFPQVRAAALQSARAWAAGTVLWAARPSGRSARLPRHQACRPHPR